MKKLVLFILLLLLVVPVSADEVSVSSWEELSDAITAEERTITLTQPISTESAGDGLTISGNITITGESIDACQSGRLFIVSGNLTIINTTLTGGKTIDSGGAVSVVGGRFTLTDGSITNCSADFTGGAVMVYPGATFVMDNSTIDNCTASAFGSGVCTMGEFIMTNESAINGGVYVSPMGTFNVEGTPVIDDLYLETNDALTVTGQLTTTSEIHVSNPVEVGKFGISLVNTDVSCFIAENLIAKITDGELVWAVPPTITIETRHGTVITSQSGMTVTITATPDEHFSLQFITVYKTGDSTATITVEDNKFTLSDYDVTISATFIGEQCDVAFDTQVIRQTYGEKYILPDTPTKTGYTFAGWFIGNTRITADSIVTTSENVHSHWDKIRSPDKADKGTSIWLTATPTVTPTPEPTIMQPVASPIKPTSVTTPLSIIWVFALLAFLKRR